MMQHTKSTSTISWGSPVLTMCMAHTGQDAISTSATCCLTGNGMLSVLPTTSIVLSTGELDAGISAFMPATLIVHITISTDQLCMYRIGVDIAGELTADIATTIDVETISALLYTTQE